jgi:hypothetical protein
VTFASYDIFFLQNSYKKYTVNEIKQLKKQTKLLSMYSQDASIAEIQRWLLSERIKSCIHKNTDNTPNLIRSAQSFLIEIIIPVGVCVFF